MQSPQPNPAPDPASPGAWSRIFASRRVVIGGAMLSIVLLASLITLPWTLQKNGALAYNTQHTELSFARPTLALPFGADQIGQNLLGRCLLGGIISLSVGIAAAFISTIVGVSVGLIAGYRGGWIDGVLMRTVDVLYGLPYILMIILLRFAIAAPLANLFHSPPAANLVVLFLSIGLVSWLTMARVIRGQVLSLRALPFIESARALGLPERRIFLRHLLPNLVGPITVYATLIIPQAILQESFLSFLGVGVQEPMPTWGALAAKGLWEAMSPLHSRWWLLLFPCLLLAVTLLSLNFVGDGLRDAFDPKRNEASTL